MDDPYRRMRVVATPSDEICSCSGDQPIKLMWALSANPIHCLNCNLEIDPGRLSLPPELVDPVADWCGVAGAIGRLEIDSGRYEAWAREELLDLASAVNQQGRAVRELLDAVRRCYFWIFQTQGGDGYVTPSSCPACSSPLTPWNQGIFPQLVCDDCSVVLGG